MTLTLARAAAFIRADATMLSKDFLKARAQILAQTRSLGRSMGSTLQAAFAGIGAVGVVRGFSSMIHSGEQFERMMRNSTAIMGDVTDQLEEMRQKAFEVGRTTKFSASTAAESYYFLASAGLDAKQSLAAMPQVAQFGQAGMFDMAVATELLTDAQAAMGLTVKDATKNLENMTRVSDVLVKANTLSDASVQEFALSLTRKAAAAGRIAKMELEEVVAVLAAFAKQGTKSYLGGQAFNIVLRDLTTKAIVNKEAFKRLGVEVYKTDGSLNKMSNIIGDLERMTAGLTVEQAKMRLRMLGLADKSLIFTQTLMGTSREIAEFEEQLKQAGGTTQEVSDKQLTPLQKSMARLGSTATETGTLFMKSFGPYIYGLLESVTVAIKAMGEALRGVQGEFIAATAVITGFTVALRAAQVAAVMLGVSFKSLLVGTGIAAVIAVMAGAVVTINNFIERMRKLAQFQLLSKELAGELAYAWADLKQAMSLTAKAISEATRNFWEWLESTIQFRAFSVLTVTVVKMIGDGIVALGKIVLGLSSDWEVAANVGKTAMYLMASTLHDAVNNMAHNTKEFFTSLVMTAHLSFKAVYDAVGEWMTSASMAFSLHVEDMLDDLNRLRLKALEVLKGNFSGTSPEIKKIEETMDARAESIKAIVNSMNTLVNDVMSGKLLTTTSPKYKGFIDPSTFTRGLRAAMAKHLRAAMAKGEWLHIWKNPAEALADAVEDALGEMTVPLKFEFMNYDELGKSVQDAIFKSAEEGMNEGAKKGAAEAEKDTSDKLGGGLAAKAAEAEARRKGLYGLGGKGPYALPGGEGSMSDAYRRRMSLYGLSGEGGSGGMFSVPGGDVGKSKTGANRGLKVYWDPSKNFNLNSRGMFGGSGGIGESVADHLVKKAKEANPMAYAGYFDPSKPSQTTGSRRPNLWEGYQPVTAQGRGEGLRPPGDTSRLALPGHIEAKQIESTNRIYEVLKRIDNSIATLDSIFNNPFFTQGIEGTASPILQKIDSVFNNLFKGAESPFVDNPASPDVIMRRRLDAGLGRPNAIQQELLNPPASRYEQMFDRLNSTSMLQSQFDPMKDVLTEAEKQTAVQNQMLAELKKSRTTTSMTLT